jgi:Tau and MAP protein, tubulin-binding repeat
LISLQRLVPKSEARTTFRTSTLTLQRPGGGDKKVETQALDFSHASPKVGSKENLSHKAGGGDKKIPTKVLDFKEKASSKVGSKVFRAEAG